MASPTNFRWAVLICKYNDDANDPLTVRVRDIHAQWQAQFGAAWLGGNLVPEAAADDRTLFELYETFFTIAGVFTFGAVRYFDDMSHGQLYVGDSKVFPCKLDISASDAVTLADDYVKKFGGAGGVKYQEDMFQRAKRALQAQHGIDWETFDGTIVSFQDADGGAQGYHSIDGGPGVFMSFKYLRNQGTAAWGHEMGHGFGLNDSKTNGDPNPYTDPWDVMSASLTQMTPDATYGQRGPGINAWNMRSLGWLDETRVWKKSAASTFSETIQLRPLHQRNLAGHLAAELPGIGGDSDYLVEFRTPNVWDEGLGMPLVLLHRFGNGESYLMPGTAGQKFLGVGDRFLAGSGPFSSLRVVSIDAANQTATVQLCHSMHAADAPSVKIVGGPGTSPLPSRATKASCHPQNIEGGQYWFKFELTGSCLPDYQILWNVTGGSVFYPTSNSSPLFVITLPAATVETVISLTIIFADGRTVSDTQNIRVITEDEARWIEFLCNLLHERKSPAPWWQWNPAAIREVAKSFSEEELGTVISRAEQVLGALTDLRKLRS